MKQLFEAFNSGSAEQQKRRKLGALVIAVTAILLALTLVVLAVGSIVIAIAGPENDPKNSDDGADYITTTLDAATQLNTGDLLLLDSEHPYSGSAPDAVLFYNHESRPKNEENGHIYTIFGTTKLAATDDTVVAFHAMVRDFYAAIGDDDLILSQAYDLNSGNQPAQVYMTAAAIQLDYYSDFDTRKTASIYGVEDYQWIYDNAAKYGFVRASSAEGEENIFRYVGQPHATYMQKNNLTLSAYLELLRTKTHRDPLKASAEVDGQTLSYNIYYVSANDTAYVPPHGNYTVSGDNLGGYIITAENQ